MELISFYFEKLKRAAQFYFDFDSYLIAWEEANGLKCAAKPISVMEFLII